VLADMLDGAMARERGYGTKFGGVLDATCDRIADGASSAACCGGRRSNCTTPRWRSRP
jgi:phosphatidylglycerophosphate synthase